MASVTPPTLGQSDEAVKSSQSCTMAPATLSWADVEDIARRVAWEEFERTELESWSLSIRLVLWSVVAGPRIVSAS